MSGIYHQPVQKYKKGGTVDIYWDADEYWHYLGRKVNVLGQFALWTGSFNTTDLQHGATWRSASQSICFNFRERTPGTYKQHVGTASE